jgi:hypothetical protein
MLERQSKGYDVELTVLANFLQKLANLGTQQILLPELGS